MKTINAIDDNMLENVTGGGFLESLIGSDAFNAVKDFSSGFIDVFGKVTGIIKSY